MPILATFIQHSIGSPSHSREEKEIKVIQIGKEEVNHHCSLILYRDSIYDTT